MSKFDPQYPTDPSFAHCHGENYEDKSDNSIEYCNGDSEICNCKCEECVALIAEFWAYEREIAAADDQYDHQKDDDLFFEEY